MGWSDSALANLVQNADLVELVAPASGAGTLTAQAFLKVQDLSRHVPADCDSGIGIGRSQPAEPLLNVVDCTHTDDPFVGQHPGLRPRRGRQGKVYASARFDAGRENVPPVVLRDY